MSMQMLELRSIAYLPMHFGVVRVVELLQHEAVGSVRDDLLRHSYRSVHAYIMGQGYTIRG
jgi:hypothetical protein